MEVLKPDATGIYVAAHQATAAIEEAIEAEVPLIVAVAEHIPLHDIMRVSLCKRNHVGMRLIEVRYTRYYRLNPNLGLWAQMHLESSQQSAGVGLASSPYPPFRQATLAS
jgi:hypothetical protein